jgi:Arc/MetJ-type ribon-helix-helix transcriptional regulator/uncharacterized protein YukE
MADLAKLVVKLEAQTAQYQKKLETSDRRLKRFEKDTKRSLSKVATSFKTILGGVAVGALVRNVVRATEAQEQAVKQLETGLASTGNIVGQSIDELTKKAAELQKATTFGDEDIIAAQAQLVTFTGIVRDQFDRTIEAALDLSTRMDQDLKSSVVQLGKALNDPVANLSALSRAGIQFSNDQKSVIKSLVETNRLAEAQDVILQELERQFGGSAKAARDTFGGALDGLSNAFGDLFEATDGLGDAKADVESLTSLLQDPATVDGINNLVSGVIKLTSGFLKMTAAGTNGLKNYAEQLAAITNGPASIKEAITDLGRLQKLGANLDNTNIQARFQRNDDLIRSMLGFASIDELKRYQSQIQSELSTTYKNIGKLQERGQTGESAEPFLQSFVQLRQAIDQAIDAREMLTKVSSQSGLNPVNVPSETNPQQPINPTARAEFLESLAEEDRRWKAIGATLTSSVLTPQEEYKGLVMELDSALAHSAVTQETYNRKLTEYQEQLAESTPGIQSMAELNQILTDTLPPQEAAFKAIREQIAQLVEAMGQFPEKSDAIGLAIQNLRAEEQALIESTKEAADELSVFGVRAAENIQDALGGTLTKTLKGDFDSIGQLWGDMLVGMAAEAASTRLAEFFDIKGLLTGTSTGGDGGSIGDFFGGFFADGGRPHPGKVSVVGEQGPELFIPDGVSGQIMPNGASSGSSVSVGQMVFPGVTNEREAKRASGTMRRELAKLLDESRRY